MKNDTPFVRTSWKCDVLGNCEWRQQKLQNQCDVRRIWKETWIIVQPAALLSVTWYR